MLESISSPPRPTVLVVEDDPKLSRLLCRALQIDGLDVHAVGDGLEALERLRDRPYGAVVLDLGLPGVDGLTVCTALRRHGSAVPVVILSARDDIDDVENGMRAGATDYIVKPCNLGLLASRVAALAVV